ncbi:MAG: 6,7-dimethyl-8-ribityllumazine synthase [Acidimicrobiales bacterium]|jgi:6,7-dimethyl-8-ribityllumazine synthase
MTSSDLTALPDDAKSRAASRVGWSIDPVGLAADAARGVRVGLACAEFNGGITDRLLVAALDELEGAGCQLESCVVAWVPGAFELPLVARGMAASGRVDVIVALGAVIRGDTGHYDFVAGECASGLQRVQLDSGLPVVFGVLTTDNVEQALARSRPDATNKGAEAARTALEMLAVLRGLEGLPGGSRVGFTVGGR